MKNTLKHHRQLQTEKFRLLTTNFQPVHEKIWDYDCHHGPKNPYPNPFSQSKSPLPDLPVYCQKTLGTAKGWAMNLKKAAANKKIDSGWFRQIGLIQANSGWFTLISLNADSGCSQTQDRKFPAFTHKFPALTLKFPALVFGGLVWMQAL